MGHKKRCPSMPATPRCRCTWRCATGCTGPAPSLAAASHACGACTVHVDGVAIRSCVTPISAVQGKTITTIEALGTADKPHALLTAWLAAQVPQCGYCQSGMLMAATALLSKNHRPSDADIDAAITNLCRCGTCPRVRAANSGADAAAQSFKLNGVKLVLRS